MLTRKPIWSVGQKLRRVEDKASRILNAAGELLVSYGYRRITVDQVARRAGVGKSTVHLYWPSKLELFGAGLTRGAAVLHKQVC